MAQYAQAVSITGTKNADGSVTLVFGRSLDGLNPIGDIRYAVVIASADFTSLNTTVNGGATGATLTVTYAENVRVVDYPNTYSPSLG
jgi:hypothetical protein